MRKPNTAKRVVARGNLVKIFCLSSGRSKAIFEQLDLLNAPNSLCREHDQVVYLCEPLRFLIHHPINVQLSILKTSLIESTHQTVAMGELSTDVNMELEETKDNSSMSIPAKPFIFHPTKEQAEVLELLEHNPESITDHQLTTTPLRVVSKGVGKEISSCRIVDIYLRWLEVQSLADDTNYNKHWETTVAQWTQSLRARGFKLFEVINDVERWKTYHGQILKGSTRSFPTSQILGDIWAAPEVPPQVPRQVKRRLSKEEMDQEDEKHRKFNFRGGMKYGEYWKHRRQQGDSISKYYTCNRCGEGG